MSSEHVSAEGSEAVVAELGWAPTNVMNILNG